MAIIMLISKFAQNLAQDVLSASASTHMEYPESLQKTNDWAGGAMSQKGKAYSVYECPNEALSECLIFLAKRYSKIAAAVPGYKYKIELLMTREDAAKML